MVIGILIALQINNWNEARKLKQVEIDTLIEIRQDIKATLVDIELDSVLHKISLDATTEILDFITSDRPWHDTLTTLFELAYYDFRISSIEAAYRSLQGKGVDLISNLELRKLISSFYDYSIPWLRRVETGNGRFNDLLFPYYQKHFGINEDQGIISTRDIDSSKRLRNQLPRGFIPIDLDALKNDPEFKVLIREAAYLRIEIYQAYINAKRKAYLVLSKINEEIGIEG